MEEDIRFHKGFTPVDPRGAASRTNSNWKLELCSLRGIYVQASGGGLIKLPRQWFRPDLISSWLVLLLPSSWTLSLSLFLHYEATTQVDFPASTSHPLHSLSSSLFLLIEDTA